MHVFTYLGVVVFSLMDAAAFDNRSCINEGDSGKSSCRVFDRLEPPDRFDSLFRFKTSLRRTCDGLGDRNSDSCKRCESGVDVCNIELTGVETLKPVKIHGVQHKKISKITFDNNSVFISQLYVKSACI